VANSGRVVIDIECVASPQAAELLDPVRAPGNYKDPAKIAQYVADEFESRVKRAGLEADLCEVVAVGFLRDHEYEPTVLTRHDAEESALLWRFWSEIGNAATIGFNSLGYDLPVLVRRSQLLGIPYPAVNLDRYRTPHIDLSEELSFRGKLTMRSLRFYCKLFNIPCADATSGADVAALVAAGDWSAIAEHCRADVDKTAALARRLGYLPMTQVA
jgi:Predicted 3'-5' exonuclease related to the exonuclease domain of PolB